MLEIPRKPRCLLYRRVFLAAFLWRSSPVCTYPPSPLRQTLPPHSSTLLTSTAGLLVPQPTQGCFSHVNCTDCPAPHPCATCRRRMDAWRRSHPTPENSRPARGEPTLPVRAKNHRRRGSCGLPQRRQVHLAGVYNERQTEGRHVPLHHPNSRRGTRGVLGERGLSTTSQQPGQTGERAESNYGEVAVLCRKCVRIEPGQAAPLNLVVGSATWELLSGFRIVLADLRQFLSGRACAQPPSLAFFCLALRFGTVGAWRFRGAFQELFAPFEGQTLASNSCSEVWRI